MLWSHGSVELSTRFLLKISSILNSRNLAGHGYWLLKRSRHGKLVSKKAGQKQTGMESL
jgi:hypothetical protein